ncbi:stage III sporulation protein AF [Clostridium magnum]|uniref:Stage III sporulation protein SpoIIIAF n=1 Tax=Clostridium magnum DSM 2767 TaxID=1121326 RepID=A0A162URI3_9CLOT|nr:stage III sporulation protein AF [Clostridium magnum]KZL94217.1 stage III sporulation protein SpoIIIAF [Clostridium magnum DSM 2767]SHH92604.1 stage III sporulation protein AF [Clostridium magnum DSM 2767]
MLQALREWLITICTAIFFITAVEIVLPDNSTKKYAKFVLGLILITVFINPIIKLFDRNFDINTYTTDVIQNFDKGKTENEFRQYQEKNLSSTLEVFKLNLQTSCEKKLKEKYPDSNYKVEADASYDSENDKIVIKDIRVGVKEGGIEKIKKIQIGGDAKSVNSSDNMDNEKSMEIKKYLSNELNVSKDVIQIYKL